MTKAASSTAIASVDPEVPSAAQRIDAKIAGLDDWRGTTLARVRHIIGLDPARRGVAIAEHPPLGARLAFCERHVQAAHRVAPLCAGRVGQQVHLCGGHDAERCQQARLPHA